jgi:hypothetical protein
MHSRRAAGCRRLILGTVEPISQPDRPDNFRESALEFAVGV